MKEIVKKIDGNDINLNKIFQELMIMIEMEIN